MKHLLRGYNPDWLKKWDPKVRKKPVLTTIQTEELIEQAKKEGKFISLDRAGNPTN